MGGKKSGSGAVRCGGGACTSGKMYLVPKGKALVPGIVGGVSGDGGEGGSAHAWKCMAPPLVRAQLKRDDGT